jgi:hypothetical protein
VGIEVGRDEIRKLENKGGDEARRNEVIETAYYLITNQGLGGCADWAKKFRPTFLLFQMKTGN